jgi:signal transduction histidine kinase/CheY-like chemotaxis protein/HPt (histidine-containing phosphotransfer) domain-containing protein
VNPFLGARSVRTKVFAGVLLTTISALVVSGVIMVLYDLRSYHQGWVNDLTTQGELLGRASAPALQFDDPDAARANLALLSVRPQIRLGAIYDANGQLFASFGRDDADLAALSPQPTQPGSRRTGGELLVSQPIIENGERLGTIQLVAQYGLEDRVWGFAGIVLGVALFALAIAMALSTALQRSITQPILAITNLAREVKQRRDYSLRAKRTTNDEVGYLVDAFNDMLAEVGLRTQALESSKGQLEETAEALRQAKESLEGERALLAQRVEERTAELVKLNGELMSAKQAADAANNAKSAFLAAMSHDIRTPMNGVVGTIDLLRESRLDDRQAHLLNVARDSAFSLLRVIDDILDFTKIEADKVEIERVEFRLDQLVDNAAATLWPTAVQRGVRLHCFFDPRLPAHVVGDSVRLRQILFNLLGNAIKFRDTEKTERYASIRAELDDSVTPPMLRFVVEDNGIGMSRDTLRRVFKAFEQADVSTTRRYGGTGLGLAISRRLAELMGGTITVQSEAGAGTRFTTTLPLERGSTAVEPLLEGVHVFVDASVKQVDTIAGYLVAEGATFELVHVGSSEIRHDGIALVDAHGDVQQRLMAARKTFPAQRLVLLIGDEQTPASDDRAVVYVRCRPLGRSGLVHGICCAAGRESPYAESAITNRTEVRLPAPSVDDAERAGCLILVVEDSEVNQEVIQEQLAQIGHASIVASNGIEALELLRKNRVGLVLTDCHMPQMDGYELTAALRNHEDAAIRNLPIIAFTANALKGEAERCIAAGMSDYVSKPVQMSALRAVIERWMPRKAPSTVVYDSAALGLIVGDNPDLQRRVVERFLAAAPMTASEVNDLVQAGRTADLGRVAHRLKSSARTVGAVTLAERCASLEQDALNEDALEDVDQRVAELVGLLDAACQHLRGVHSLGAS